MNTMRVFSVYDEKAAAFIVPFFLPEQAMAIRTFTASACDDQHQFGRFPEDYTLFEIGLFDLQSGQYEPYDAKLCLGSALEARAEEKKIELWRKNQLDLLQEQERDAQAS